MAKTLREIMEERTEEINRSGELVVKLSENLADRSINDYVPRMKKEVIDKTEIVLGEPFDAYPNEDGSIDFYWKTDRGELLLNVGSNRAKYYGDFKKDGKTIKLKGEFN